MRMFIKSALAAAGLLVTISASEALPVVYMQTGGGSGTTCGTRTAPCGSFGSALSAVDSGGDIVCLDAGPFVASINLGKAFTLNCPGGVVLNIFYFYVTVGPNETVKLNGVTLNGQGAEYEQTALLVRGGHVILENCTVKNARQHGIHVNSENSSARLTLINTILTDNAAGNVLARAVGSHPASVVLDRVTMTNSVFGLRAEGSGAGNVDVEAHASVAAHHSGNGFIAVSNAGQGQVRFKITKSVSHNNAAFGAVATGPQAFMIVGDTSLTKNGTGLAQLNGATVATYSNNDVNFNTTNTAGTITTIPRR